MYSEDTRPLYLLSKREEIAKAAMQGILSNHWCENQFGTDIKVLSPNDVSNQAVLYADALLKELEKPPAP
jgi:hypothetical protein